MAVTNLQVLNNTRINGVFQGLADPRLLPQPLVFSQRVDDVPAEDGEIMARYIGGIQIADLVADDQQAVTYSAGKLQFESTTIPNLKVGAVFTQAMIKQLRAIQAGGNITRDQVGLLDSYIARAMMNVKTGIAWRKEALCIAMAVDSLSYDRLGIKLSGTWGMPSDLKVTPSTAWTDAANATPVNDIWAVKLVASRRYGQVYNHVTMSTPAFQLMIATTEFQAKARMNLAPNVSYTNLVLANLDQQRAFASNVLGMEIELYDGHYQTQDERGVITYQPFLPLNKVVLSYTGDDRNPMSQDFANGEVTEVIVSGIMGEPVGGGATRGPIAYITGNETLNPPNLTVWGVQRGFPRKHNLYATAVLTVGTITDTVSQALPF